MTNRAIPPIHDHFGVVIPWCRNCAHFYRDAPGATCAAYPERIPLPILGGDVDHREPFPGDNGIRWAPATDAPDGP